MTGRGGASTSRGMARAEPPSLNEVEKEVHRPGMILALEPKVRSDKSAVHLEEDVLITENGTVDLMAHIPVEAGEIETLMRRK